MGFRIIINDINYFRNSCKKNILLIKYNYVVVCGGTYGYKFR